MHIFAYFHSKRTDLYCSDIFEARPSVISGGLPSSPVVLFSFIVRILFATNAVVKIKCHFSFWVMQIGVWYTQ